MFTVIYKGLRVICDSAAEAVEFTDAADKPQDQATRPHEAKDPDLRSASIVGRKGVSLAAIRRTTRRKKTRRKATKPNRAEKDQRNAKARADYLEKHPAKVKTTTTTTSRLEALPSKPIGKGRGKGSRANTGQAVIDTLKRSPSPLTLEEIDTDLEKSGWPYKGADRKGAIRATLGRLKASGTVSISLRGTGPEAMKMFRLERTNGETPSPVEQAIENGKDGAEQAEQAEQAIAAEAAAEEPPDSQLDFI